MESESPNDSDAGGPRDPDLDAALAAALPVLVRYIASRGNDATLARDEAEDLAQSVCRDLVERADGGAFELRTEPELRAWLFEAARRKVRERLRRNTAGQRDVGREAARVDDSDPARRQAVEPRDSVTPSRLVMGAERRARVRAAVDRLGGRDAEVLRLVVLEGLPHAAAAERLGIGPAHSRVLLSRALSKLAGELDGDAEFESRS